MDTYLVYTFNAYATPKIKITEITEYDIISAINFSGVNTSEIISVKLKSAAENIAGI